MTASEKLVYAAAFVTALQKGGSAVAASREAFNAVRDLRKLATKAQPHPRADVTRMLDDFVKEV